MNSDHIGVGLFLTVVGLFAIYSLDARINELEYATKLKNPPTFVNEEIMNLNGWVFSASDSDIVVKQDYIAEIDVSPAVQQNSDFNTNIPTSNFSESLIQMFKKSEGRVMTKNGLHRAYRDSRKFLTIGYGCCIDCGCLNGTGVKLNESKTIDEATAMYLLRFHINVSISSVRKEFKWFDKQPNSVKLVLVDMAYNMGIGNLKKFKFLNLIKAGKYYEAGEALESGGKRYISQVGGRARTNIKLLKSTKLL